MSIDMKTYQLIDTQILQLPSRVLKLLLGLGAQSQKIGTLFKLWVWFYLTKAHDYFSLYFPEPKTEGKCYSYLLYIEVVYVSKFLRQGRIL